LLLIGTGAGLSPLVGIIRDALHHRHESEIYLYHVGQSQEAFYWREKIQQLELSNTHFHYQEFITEKSAELNEVDVDQSMELAFAKHNDLRGWQVYLAGQASMVNKGEQLAAAHGAVPNEIHTAAFALRELRKTSRGSDQDDSSSQQGNMAESLPKPVKSKYPPPDPELWRALDDGALLMEILKDFYARAFQDERLSAFFHGVTMQRAIEKQYLFVRQILTGEKIYFGDRPRNAHHWMVISNELLDYRSNIMNNCLHMHGLSAAMIHRYLQLEEYYRDDIVKAAPFGRKVGDVEIPFEGFGEITMDVGTLCDSCGKEVAAGEKVKYHVRIGKVYCSDCNAPHHHEVRLESNGEL
jgi:truncated hemoglobin YjbI